LAYHWGDGDLMVHTVEMIAERKGFGDVVAEGVDRMSKRFGPETQPFNITVKGQELPMHEPRLKYGLGVGYAVAPVGADHMTNIHDTGYTNNGRNLRRVNTALDKPIAPVPANVLNEEKMLIFYNEVNFLHMLDSALVCHFYPYDYEQVVDLVSGVTGVAYNIRDIIAAGARVNTLARLFNLREGFTEKDDKIPRRVMKAFKEGPIAGNEITDEDFYWARNRFYEMMDWDPQTGVPTEACLQKFGITDLLP
jgi:aldehyde:ferredoxin oxidoreductase